MGPQSMAFASSGLVERMNYWTNWGPLHRLVAVHELVLQRLAPALSWTAVVAELLQLISTV
jgi:hypothetical protein